MTKYRKKPVEIEAVQFFDTTESIMELSDFIGEGMSVDYADRNHPELKIETKLGQMRANIGDYVVKGGEGDFFIVDYAIFNESYEKVE